MVIIPCCYILRLLEIDKHEHQLLYFVFFVTPKSISSELSLREVAALNVVSFGFFRLMPVLNHVHAFSRGNCLVDSFELYKSGPETLRPIVVPSVLKWMELVIVS